MIEIYSALLLHEAKLPITEENIKKILASIGASIDEGRIKALVASLEGQNIDELLKQAVAITTAPTAGKEEEEKKKKEEEKKAEEAAIAGLGALFG
jgi:large subunit ribosomal protein L12